MLADIKTLSGPAYGGRLTGSAQDEASATFVANRFSELRLHRTPAFPPENQTNPLPQREWKQTSAVPTRTIGEEPLLELVTPVQRVALHSGSHFLPVLDSPSADIRGRVVFVGYGIVDSSQGIDDYAGLDVRNAIVLFLRGKPETYAKPVSHADKERLAKQRGAIGYLTATGPILSAYEQRRGVTGTPSAYYSATASDDQLPGAWIQTETAEWILAKATSGDATLRSIQEALNRLGSQSRRTDAIVEMKWTSVVKTGTLFNVMSIIRGYAHDSDETVLLGAHRDHFGQQAGLLFAGADDNASGTAVLLEVARLFALAPAPPKRSVLFLSFSGEEQGLLGSRLYIEQPIVPLSKTTGMINVDHAGAGNGRLTVGVVGFEKSLAQRVGEMTGLSDKLDVFGYFPGGDHVPFKEAGVPTVAVVSGGVHPHFHQPTDTVETVNPEILQSVARYVFALTWQLANQP
ncbi:MAG TPA: M28 family peptidase [Nitrospira sp.]|nr:M28 family peptidase [Nitrospira sp.]